MRKVKASDLDNLDIDTIRRSIGNDFLCTLSKNVASSPKQAVEELVANSYDEDATEVRITYRPGESLEVSDNGRGMNTKDFDHFFRLGDSIKLDVERTKRGRVPLGSYGLASLSVRILGDNYTVDSVKGRKRTRVSESFVEEGPTLEKKLPMMTTRVPRGTASGTTIRVTDLKFTKRTAFSEQELMDHLAETMPVEDPKEFRIFVNKKVVRSKAIENAVRFRVDYQGEHMGHATGTMYLTGKSTARAGIHIRVNKRRIGDPKKVINMADIKNSLTNRVIAIIDADDLAPYIRSDRGGFNPSEAYEELCVNIVNQLKEIRRFTTQRTRTNRARVIKGQTKNILSEVRGRAVYLDLLEFKQGFALKMSDELDSDAPGIIARKDKEIILNARHPSLRPESFKGRADYMTAIEAALIDVLAADRTHLKRANDFWRTKKELYNLLHPVKLSKQDPSMQEVFPTAVYSPAALSHLSRFSTPDIKYLCNGKVIIEARPNEIVGSEFLKAQEYIGSLVPLPTFVKQFYSAGTSSPDFYKKRAEDLISQMGDAIEPFVFNRGTKKNPCFLFEPISQVEVRRIIGSLDRRKHSFNPKKAAKSMSDMCVSAKTLTEMSGFSRDEIYQVIKFAERNGGEIGEGRMRGGYTTYNLRDFVETVQEKRKHDYKVDKDFQGALVRD